MADLKLTDEELALLWAEVPPARSDADLAVLIGQSTIATPTVSPTTADPKGGDAAVSVPAATPALSGGGQIRGDYSWLQALPLVPEHRQLILRYPAIGLKNHGQHGLVLMAAYLEDTSRRIRRNLMLGDHIFHHSEAIEVTEPDTRLLGCRIVIKTLRHQVGMKIRFWQNEPQGDAIGRSGTYEIRESRLQLVKGSKGVK